MSASATVASTSYVSASCASAFASRYAFASARGRLTPTARKDTVGVLFGRLCAGFQVALGTAVILHLTSSTSSPPPPPPPPPPEHAPPPPPPLQLRTTSTPPTDLASFVRAFADYDFIHRRSQR